MGAQINLASFAFEPVIRSLSFGLCVAASFPFSFCILFVRTLVSAILNGYVGPTPFYRIVALDSVTCFVLFGVYDLASLLSFSLSS